MHSTTITTAVVVLATIYAVCATEEHHKRAPSGFTGVRGKKSIADSAYAENDGADLKPAVSESGSVSKRAYSGFMGMRGKKPFPAWEGTYPDGDEMYKRAPSGFMGMRGKKEMEFANYGNNELYKRAPSGFMGMRGKKESEDGPAYSSGAIYDVDLAKRAPVGFFGMRGKKDFADLLEGDDKRAPSGFFGMRGKKMLRSSFFGMRGKKYPYEFRGKFVGVRGKKSADEINRPDYFTPADELDLNQLMLLLTENHHSNGGESEEVWNGENEIGQLSQN